VNSRINAAAWPVAILLVVHRVFIIARNGTPTDDFTTVFNAVTRMSSGQPVYEQAYNHVDPLYLYTPGATLLLAPLAHIDFSLARGLFIVANAAAIVAALAVLTLVVGRTLTSAVWPVSIALAFVTESVTNTLAFTNINGILLLCMAVFLWAFVRAERTPWLGWVAGVVIGLAIVIKPQFAPLLFLPLVKLQWRSLATGIGLPVILNLLAWPLVPGASGFVDNLLPYLSETRDYANSSWAGFHAYVDFGAGLYWTVWLIFAALSAAAILGLLRFRNSDPTLWALTTSGAIMVGIFFLSSLGQQYYSMWLFPLMFTVVLKRSVFHSAGAWFAAFLYLAPVSWASTAHPDAGRWMNFFTATAGWALLIVAIFATVAGWWRAARSTV